MKKATAQLLDDREFNLPLKLRQRRRDLQQNEVHVLALTPPPPMRSISPRIGAVESTDSSVSTDARNNASGAFITQSVKVGRKVVRTPALATVVEKLHLSPRARLQVQVSSNSRDCGHQLDIIAARQAEVCLLD